VDKYIPSIAPNNILSGNEEFSLVLNLPTIIENLFIPINNSISMQIT